MLVLLLRIADRHYGLDARDIAEVLPCVPLQPLRDAPEGIAGMLQHRDGAAPVIDLIRLRTGVSPTALLSTRLVLLRPDALSGSVALLVEGATQMLRIDAPADPTALLVLPDGTGVALVGWRDLIPPALHARLPASPPP